MFRLVRPVADAVVTASLITLATSPALADAVFQFRDRVALSMREKLQVPEGWCSAGFRAKLYR